MSTVCSRAKGGSLIKLVRIFGKKVEKKRKKIVIQATAIGHSNRGIGQYERAVLPLLIYHLVNKGHYVTVILSKDGSCFPMDKSAKFIKLPIRRDNTLFRILVEQLYIPWLCRGADAFISLESVFPLVHFRAKSKLVVIHDIHVLRNKLNPYEYPEDYSFQYKLWANMATRRAIKDSTRIIVISRFTGDELSYIFNIPCKKIITIHCGIDHSRFFPLPGHERNNAIRAIYQLPPKFYLYIGPFSHKKNLRLIIEALGCSQPDGSWNYPVVVAGDTRRNKLYCGTKDLIFKYRVEKQFYFLGTVPNIHLPLLYRAAHAFLYPSFYEGFGLPPIESMACGTPVIASNRSSLPEVLGDAVLYVDPNDPNSMVNAMRKINEKTIYEDLKKRGLERAKQFSWDKTARLISKAINEELGDY